MCVILREVMFFLLFPKFLTCCRGPCFIIKGRRLFSRHLRQGMPKGWRGVGREEPDSSGRGGSCHGSFAG